jgi:hypothetical protein
MYRYVESSKTLPYLVPSREITQRLGWNAYGRKSRGHVIIIESKSVRLPEKIFFKDMYDGILGTYNVWARELPYTVPAELAGAVLVRR